MKKEEKDKNARAAAFFDFDGTLMPLPSLEQRFFRTLRYHREIPLKNYFLWLSEGLRLMLQGISAVIHANKMYLKGVNSFEERGSADRNNCGGTASSRHGEGQVSTPPRRNPRWLVPRFFAEGMERLAWHARQGHVIVIVSGTLEPLANAAARALETQLAARGIAANIRVCATRLEESDGKWTGRILGEAMFGEAKARAVKKLVQTMKLDLARCWAYGDAAQDRWMLATVGHPAAVNPAVNLAPIAKKRNWPVLYWTNEKDSTHRAQSSQRTPGRSGRDCGLLASAFDADRSGSCISSSASMNVTSRSLR